ncbi:dipeptidase PepV [Lactococcus termiticola]|uniref:Dipeptidase PepV n=1 Tax=Lactococcus termiticola TaxID=2169526 RepID=A0A2R5HE61_9LACT|nr:dipeptidase PepV [Lactococcus termiticola]GBG96374.1 dipeptidase PepV [Lactococcus termiticola]
MATIDFTAEVEKRKDALMEDLFTILKVNSERDDSKADKENPFGPGPRKALDTFLAMAERDGYKTSNFDNYAGHFEFGEGDEVLGIIGHLDVVPAADQEGWNTNPYEPVIKDGNLYARGASDDKGPTIACYYGLKIIKELGLPLSKKIRFIVGTDEESGWGDMDYYFEHCDLPLPDFGFSPDAEFPIINGEKGNVSEIVKFNGKNAGATVLHSFKSGLRLNMVPEVATAVISGEVADLQAKLDAFLAENASKNLTCEIEEAAGKYTLTMHGKGAHGAMPEKGVNAATYLALFLQQLSFADGAKAYIDFAADLLLEDHEGEKLGIAYTDELMGNTSMNAGVWVFDENGEASIALNFRFPQGNTPERMQEILAGKAGVTEVEIAPHVMTPHYVPENDPLVSTLLSVYEKHTGLKGYETIIGGGTFGRLLERGVAYGAMFEGEEDTMHQSNEYKPVDAIFKSAAIYAEAIYELAK